MIAIEHALTGPDQIVRGFEVHVRDLRSKKTRWISYPASGHPKYTGSAALEAMERFESRGWAMDDVLAVTDAPDGTNDYITIKEMRELFSL